MQWYYALDGQRIGPVPHAELERLIQNRTLAGDALVWRQGMDQWKSLAEVQKRDPALFAQAAPSDVPPLPDTNARTDTGSDSRAASVQADGVDSSASTSAVHDETGPAAPTEDELAGFWPRVGAHVIDLILWFFIWNILASIVSARLFPEALKLAEAITAAGGSGPQPTPEEAVMILKFSGFVMLLGLAVAVVYDLVFLLKFSATPGKLLFGLRLVKADGRPAGIVRIVARCLAKVLAGAPTLGIGYLVVLFDEQKRGLHDFLCGTRVVKKR